MGYYGIGQSVRRDEDPRLLKGRGSYAGDVTLPRQSYAYFLRSPHAHAGSLTLSARPGKLPAFSIFLLVRMSLPQSWHARYGGQAETPRWRRYVGTSSDTTSAGPSTVCRRPHCSSRGRSVDQAKSAAEMIDISFNPPSVTDTAQTITPDSPAVWDECPDNISHIHETGDKSGTDAAFKKAATIVKRRLSSPAFMLNLWNLEGSTHNMMSVASAIRFMPMCNTPTVCVRFWRRRFLAFRNRTSGHR